ncbi:MAG: ribosome maturation factor RimM [Gammaproteobacteria bacterium]
MAEGCERQTEPVVVGRVSGVFGTRGWLRIESYTRPYDNLANYQPWLLRLDSGWTPHRLLEARRHHGGLIAVIEGVTERDGAGALMRCDIGVSRALFAVPEPDEFYWADLLGLTVRNRDGIDLGRVRGMLETAAHDVVRVQRDDGGERLIPFVRDVYVLEVDLEGGVLLVDWHPDD